MEKLQVSPEHAPKFREWLQTRGGLAVWSSLDLSDPSASWTTPALTPEGSPTAPPSWKAGNKPSRVITDPTEVEVVTAKEVKRFRVAIRRGSNGLVFKLTDASTRRLRAAVEKAGEGAWYEFDYSTQEAVIFVRGEVVPL